MSLLSVATLIFVLFGDVIQAMSPSEGEPHPAAEHKRSTQQPFGIFLESKNPKPIGCSPLPKPEEKFNEHEVNNFHLFHISFDNRPVFGELDDTTPYVGAWKTWFNKKSYWPAEAILFRNYTPPEPEKSILAPHDSLMPQSEPSADNSHKASPEPPSERAPLLGGTTKDDAEERMPTEAEILMSPSVFMEVFYTDKHECRRSLFRRYTPYETKEELNQQIDQPNLKHKDNVRPHLTDEDVLLKNFQESMAMISVLKRHLKKPVSYIPIAKARNTFAMFTADGWKLHRAHHKVYEEYLGEIEMFIPKPHGTK